MDVLNLQIDLFRSWAHFSKPWKGPCEKCSTTLCSTLGFPVGCRHLPGSTSVTSRPWPSTATAKDSTAEFTEHVRGLMHRSRRMCKWHFRFVQDECTFPFGSFPESWAVVAVCCCGFSRLSAEVYDAVVEAYQSWPWPNEKTWKDPVAAAEVAICQRGKGSVPELASATPTQTSRLWCRPSRTRNTDKLHMQGVDSWQGLRICVVLMVIFCVCCMYDIVGD